MKKIVDPTEQDVVALRKQVEAEICRLYYLYRPEWETRPLSLVRGETSPTQLQQIAAQATESASCAAAAVPTAPP